MPTLSGLIGDFPLEAIEGGKVANRVDARKPGQTAENPEVVEGRVGRALKLSGENSVTLPLGNFDRYEPFSLSLWIKTPDHKERAVIIHRSMAWTDAGSRGYQLLIEDGKFSVGLIHFWPGDAIGIRAREPVPIDRWTHVAIAYDGSSRADGLALYVDGRRADCEIVRDHLTKNITGGGNDQLTVGQRFRDRGFKNGLVDEIKVFNRALSPLEVAQLHDGVSLSRVLDLDPAKFDRPAAAGFVGLLPGECRRRVPEPAGRAHGPPEGAQCAGGPGGRDHGDEGGRPRPTYRPEARGVRRTGRAGRAGDAGRVADDLTARGRGIGWGWRSG